MTSNSEQELRSITPYLTVHDADGLIVFLRSVFDAVLIKEDRYDDGQIQHARLVIGNSVVMLNEASSEYPALNAQLHLFVEDADAAYQVALKNGATSIMPPNTRPHGDRMAGINDPCGNIWWIATPANV